MFLVRATGPGCAFLCGLANWVTAEDNSPGSPECGIGHKFTALEGCTPALPRASIVGGG